MFLKKKDGSEFLEQATAEAEVIIAKAKKTFDDEAKAALIERLRGALLKKKLKAGEELFLKKDSMATAYKVVLLNSAIGIAVQQVHAADPKTKFKGMKKFRVSACFCSPKDYKDGWSDSVAKGLLGSRLMGEEWIPFDFQVNVKRRIVLRAALINLFAEALVNGPEVPNFMKRLVLIDEEQVCHIEEI